MFKYRVLTFTIILSMLLFYATPINSFEVKAEEVIYSQSQLQDVGVWFIGERLLEGAISDFDFSNLPTDLTPEDFLADLGAVLAEGDPLPLMDDMSQAIDDIWNGLIEEYSHLTTDQAWDMVKDFFYTLWYDVPQSPSLPPLVNVFGIAGDLLEAAGIDQLLQYANTDIPIPNPDPDFSFINNINNFYYDYINVCNAKFDHYGDEYLPSPNLNNCTLVSNHFIYNSYNGHIYDYSNTEQNIGFNALNGIISIHLLVNNDESVTATYTQHSPISFIPDIDYIYIIGNSNFEGSVLYGSYSSGSYTYTQNSFDGLSNAINYINQHYCNINLYVNGDPWVLANITPVNPIANTDLTYPNYEPAKYNYPEGTSVDWNRLYTIIYNAVRDGIVLDFGDLEDCFVDVNGQTAVAVLGLVRNDYDNLVQEQFTIVPYPRFNNNLWLTGLAEEMTEPAQNGVTIIENAYNIFPLPLQKTLLFAGALLLFGLLIRRFLE